MRSATEYGASGDGADDDRDAIQAAAGDATEAGGDRVHLPAGEYRIRGPITHRSGVHLVGGGTGATTIRADGEGLLTELCSTRWHRRRVERPGPVGSGDEAVAGFGGFGRVDVLRLADLPLGLVSGLESLGPEPPR